ncbi:hypothetical protein ACWIUH_09145, partial [Ursidibacter arcticus]
MATKADNTIEAVVVEGKVANNEPNAAIGLVQKTDTAETPVLSLSSGALRTDAEGNFKAILVKEDIDKAALDALKGKYEPQGYTIVPVKTLPTDGTLVATAQTNGKAPSETPATKAV